MKAPSKRSRRSLANSPADPPKGIAPEIPLAVPVADVPTATALRLYVALMRAAAAVNRHSEADIGAHGMSPGEFAILEVLFHKGPLLLGDVQRRILVSSGGITFLVDKLTRRGLVRRLHCPTDRRARYAALTAKGKALMDRIFPPHAEVIRRAVSGLGLADQRAVTTLLKTLGAEAAGLSPAERPAD